MAEPNIPPGLQLKELLASYPKLSDTCPSSWFVWSDDPDIKPISYLVKICHADMRYTPKGYDHLVTAVPKADQTSLKYLRMLIHGPFRAVSDLISLVRFQNHYYLQCDDLKKWPAPLLFNFCVASRAPIEFENQIDGWAALVKEGYPEVLAFLLSHSTGGLPFKKSRTFPVHGHHWFDSSADWRKIIDGTPDLTGVNYNKSPLSVTPSNVIWGKAYDYSEIQRMDNAKAAKHFGFEFPPPKPKERANRPYDINKLKQYYQADIEAAGAVVGQAGIQMNAAPIWAQFNQPAQLVPAQPYVAQPDAIHDEVPVDDDDDYFDDWLNEEPDD